MKRGNLQSVGRRKTSVARVDIKSGTGVITVNGKPFEAYFGRRTLQMMVRQPLVLLAKQDSIDVRANVDGGGMAGQAGAVRHALSRALVALNAEDRPALKKDGLLTRDSRAVERKKYGRHKARRRPQFSKR